MLTALGNVVNGNKKGLLGAEQILILFYSYPVATTGDLCH